jgi:conjugative transposon TraJ protein
MKGLRKRMCVRRILILAIICLMLPSIANAQSLGEHIYSLNSVLDRLFNEMMPLCSRMIDVGRATAGLAALFYISTRVWKHLAKAEAIDFYPLLRPFAIGMAIVLFPSLIALMNGVLKPTADATAEMAKDSHKAIYYHILKQEQAIKKNPPVGFGTGGNPDYEKYQQPDGTSPSNGFFSGLSNAFSFFSIKSYIKLMISETVQILYAAAGLCINTIRTFYLIVLAILGPLVLGLSVFDGFSHTLASWFARYINVYMWLPVANIFGAITSKILENMIRLDQDFFGSVTYIIFMLISIVGYTTVPNIAGYIIQAGGKDTLLHKINTMSQSAGTAAVMGAKGVF